MTLYASGCLWCLLLQKLCLCAPRDIYGCSRWPLMQLDVYQCISCALMHQDIYMDDQDFLWSNWMSWMCINTQVVARCTKTLIWMIKISLDASGFLVAQVVSYCMKGFIWMLKITLDVAGCLECLSMHKFCLEAPTYFYECPTWPLMQLDVFQCTSCVLKYNEIDMDDQCDPWCNLMSWMTIDAQVVSWYTKGFIWMLKMTLNAVGCLRCLLMH